MVVVDGVEDGRPCTQVVSGGRRRSAGGDGRSQEWERTRTLCLETDVGRARTRGCAMRDHVRAVDEETLGIHGSGDADQMVLY